MWFFLAIVSLIALFICIFVIGLIIGSRGPGELAFLFLFGFLAMNMSAVFCINKTLGGYGAKGVLQEHQIYRILYADKATSYEYNPLTPQREEWCWRILAEESDGTARFFLVSGKKDFLMDRAAPADKYYRWRHNSFHLFKEKE